MSTVSQQRNKDSKMASNKVRGYVVMTPYPIEPGHTLVNISRLHPDELRPETRSNAAHVREFGENDGYIVNRAASIMDYNRIQAGQKERQQPPSAKMSFKVFLNNSATGELTLEQRTLRFWFGSRLTSASQANKNKSPTAQANGLPSEHQELDSGERKPVRTFAYVKQEASQMAQAYFCQLIGSKPDEDFPKKYADFLMKLMGLLRSDQFQRIVKMEVELRQLPQDDHNKPPSRASSIDGNSSCGETAGIIGGPNAANAVTNNHLARRTGSPLTSQKVLDIIESAYPNPISIKEICSTTETEETLVRQFVCELSKLEKINSTDDGQHYTRTLKSVDTKVNLVKQMPRVVKAQQPVIAIITAQYCEKLAVDTMISDKETFMKFRTATGAGHQPEGSSGGELSSANYVYTLGNIGDHRVVSTKLTSIGHSRGALIAAGNATTRLLGTFPEIEYVFLVGCGGGIVNYTDFSSHVRLGDVVVSHLPPDERVMSPSGSSDLNTDNEQNSDRNSAIITRQSSSAGQKSPNDYIYVHCTPKKQQDGHSDATNKESISAGITPSYSIHKNLKKVANGERVSNTETANDDQTQAAQPNESVHQQKLHDYSDCHFRLWMPVRLDLQELCEKLWARGLQDAQSRIWEYYIDEGIKSLKQQDIAADRPAPDSDKLYMAIGSKETIEVNHPEAADDEIDLRREGRPMCHFGPIGSGEPANSSEQLKKQMISEFALRAFDSEFQPVIESIYGNRKESYIMIRGISDYTNGQTKRKEWQQYSALVAAAFMKSIIVNLPPLD